MRLDKHVASLEQECRLLLDSFSPDSGLPGIIWKYLHGFIDRVAVEEGPGYYWPLLPMIVCESLSGSVARAAPASAAIFLLMSAAELFDDIEDADSPDSLASKYGVPIATNIASTLLILAERAITNTANKQVSHEIVIEASRQLNSYYTTACTGQHLDLMPPSSDSWSAEHYFNTIAMKSGSQVACACHLGSLLAGAEDKVTDLYSQFGQNLGTAAQIANDIKGVLALRDIERKKITLPIIFGLSHSNTEISRQFAEIFTGSGTTSLESTEIRDILLNIGAIQYSLVHMELHKSKARENLQELEDLGAQVSPIQILVG